MLRIRLCSILPFLLAAGSFAQTTTTTPVPDKIILRSGHVTMCQMKKGCSEETVGGRKYLVMRTDGFLLKVASGVDRKHGFADVAITNETGEQQQVNPANFRMEESEPRLHRLSYVDPTRHEQVEERPDPRPAKENRPGNLPPPEYWTSDEHLQEKKVKTVAAMVPNDASVHMLPATWIGPSSTLDGRVYFDKPRTLKGVSVVIALPGALFEFPCNLVTEGKTKKGSKKQRQLAEAEATS